MTGELELIADTAEQVQMATASVITLRIDAERAAQAVLEASKRSWWLVAAAGQWLSLLTGAIGIDLGTFMGLFAGVAQFAQYLLPLAVLPRSMSTAMLGRGDPQSLMAVARTALAEMGPDLAVCWLQ